MRIRPKVILSIVKVLLFMFIGHWLGRFWKNSSTDLHCSVIQSRSTLRNASGSSGLHLQINTGLNNCSSRFKCPLSVSLGTHLFESPVTHEWPSDVVNVIHIGFITDGKNLMEMNGALKTIFLHRQSSDFLSIHILAPKSYWSLINETLLMWCEVGDGFGKSFNYALYDLVACTAIIDAFESYFDSVYRIAFCKLMFPYLLNPSRVPYLLLLDFDIIVVSNRFTSSCWFQAIKVLNRHPLAIFSIAHQGSPITKRLPFPMPYLQEYNAHFHFNNGIILFHIARIHELDQVLEHNATVSAAYPVQSGPRRWLRDFQQLTLKYLQSHRAKHSLTQVLWNVYMAQRAHSFVHLDQACNFQPCAKKTYVDMADDHIHFPNIVIVHLWRVCKKRDGVEANYFAKIYEALLYLPISYINRMNPTELVTSNTVAIKDVS